MKMNGAAISAQWVCTPWCSPSCA